MTVQCIMLFLVMLWNAVMLLYLAVIMVPVRKARLVARALVMKIFPLFATIIACLPNGES